jgi:F-type H+-transporting ATPase subunit delta
MSQKFTIARPYALAIFEHARQENSLPHWSRMLASATEVIRNPTMSRILGTPLIHWTQMADLLISVVGEDLSEAGRNFIRLLSMNHRLEVLPEIAKLFDRHKATIENQVKVICAYPIGAEQEQLLADTLEKRLGRTIHITIQVDQNIIGGAIIQIGDVVIDGSLRAGLTQMAEELRH